MNQHSEILVYLFIINQQSESLVCVYSEPKSVYYESIRYIQEIIKIWKCTVTLFRV
jgi:hypothetical protein